MKYNHCLFIGAIAPPAFRGGNPGCLPFGALAVASYLKEHGKSCEVVSTGYVGSEKIIKSSLRKCDIVGISSMTGPSLKYALSVVKYIRKQHRNLPIVWGGPHASLMSEEILDRGLGDYVIKGAGERRMLDLMNGKYDDIADTNYDLDEFPAIDFSFIPKKHLLCLSETYHYISSRGCPYACSFCVSSEIYNNRWRSKNAEKVVQELVAAWNIYKFKNVFFWDDNLLVDINRMKKIMRALNSQGIYFKWRCFARIEKLHSASIQDLQDLMSLGLEWISCGAESGSESTLRILNKKSYVAEISPVVLKLKYLNLPANFSFMGGIPGETKEDFYKTLKLINGIKKANPLVAVRLFKFVLYPKMPLLKDYPEVSRYLPRDIFAWSKITFQHARFKWVSKKVNNILNVFAAASMYSEKMGRYSIRTSLYHLTEWRFKNQCFVFPIESYIVLRIYGMINLVNYYLFVGSMFLGTHG
jgi:anaerobic magnesium-protoporphyrin IX monomethyl ester cyclase